MQEPSILKFLSLLGLKVPKHQPRVDWIVSSCPMAPWKHDGGTDKTPSFAVRREQGNPHTTCFSCGWHGTLSEVLDTVYYWNSKTGHYTPAWPELNKIIDDADSDLDLMFDSPDVEQMYLTPKPPPHEFPPWWIDSFPPAWETPWAMAYLKERGVPQTVATSLDLRADGTQQRVCFPVRDFHQKLRGLHGRALSPDVTPRYRMYTYGKKTNSQIWLGESWVDLNKPIIVVEGPFDLTSIFRVYRNVVSPLFATPSELKLRRMCDAYEWITLLDRGHGGDAGREKIEKHLGNTNLITHLQPPPGCKDPGVMSVEQLTEVLSPHVALDLVLS